MDFSKEWFIATIEPYKREMLYCMIIDSVVLSLTAAIILFTKVYELFFFLVIYILVEIMTNYYVFIASMVEFRLNKFDYSRVRVLLIRDELSFSGHLFTSAISFLYPKKDHMKRCIIIAEKKENKILKVRSAMSTKNAQNFSDKYISNQNQYVEICSGKYSKVLYRHKKVV